MEGKLNTGALKVNLSYRQILAIAMPISLSILVPQLNYVTNNMFVGQLGITELANAGITGVYYLIVAVVGNGLNSGLQSLIARKAGEGDTGSITTIMSQAIRIALQFALGGILFTWLLTPLCLSAFIPDTQLSPIMGFLKIRVMGLPFLYLFQLCNAFLLGTLNSRYLMIGTIVEAGMNILLDYLLIFGHWGFPALGFNGAAWASAIAEVLGLLTVLVVIYAKGLRQQFKLFSSFAYHAGQSREMLTRSIPLVLQYLISLITWLIFFILIASYSSADQAISNVMRNVFGISGIFIWAFANTANTMVSNLIGQGRSSDVLTALYRISGLSILSALTIGLLLNLFPGSFFHLFGESETFVQQGIPVMRMVSVGMLFMSITAVWLNGLTGTGKTKINLLAELAGITAYIVYTFILMKVYKVPLAMAWSNELVYWVAMFVIAFPFLRSNKWRSPALSNQSETVTSG
jgi:multidrug resistance protein, MATE family